MAYRRRTRLASQDMKTGQFAYSDELINDGYYPQLKVLPENWEPPVPVGAPMRQPAEPLFNPSPVNVTDGVILVLAQQVDQNTGQGVLLPLGTGSVGVLGTIVTTSIFGVSGTGSVGMITINEASPMGVSGTGSIGVLGASSHTTVGGVSGIGAVGNMSRNIGIAVSGLSGSGTLGSLARNVKIFLGGVSGTAAVGTLSRGMGWGEGGGWSASTWSHA